MKKIILMLYSTIVLTSCAPRGLISHVGYQSIRNQNVKASTIPKDAKISIYPFINQYGKLSLTIKNLTDMIMKIDKTQSFFTDYAGESTAYYDPSIKSYTNYGSKTKGIGINVGAVSGALGLEGPIQGILDGVNVGKSNSSGSSSTTIDVDLPIISIPPYGKVSLEKEFDVHGVGLFNNESYPQIPLENSIYKFSICIAFSIDQGKTLDKIVSSYYINSSIYVPVNIDGKINWGNDALREIYRIKPDALAENYFIIFVGSSDNSNCYYGGTSTYLQDYK